MIYEIKITLNNVGVPVWRKIQIDGKSTFEDLHKILQIAFDWVDYHLHTFIVDRVDGKRVWRTEIMPELSKSDEMYFNNEKYDEAEEYIEDWFIKNNDKITYIYDFGDDWQHEIIFIKKLKKDEGVQYPVCVGAKNIAPDEDSRSELIAGEVDLVFGDSDELIREINEEFELLENHTVDDSQELDFWPETLELAKEFHREKPWEYLGDEQIFAIHEPVTDKILYCSILGNAQELYGLAVYIDFDGLFTLVNIFSGEEHDSFDILQGQRSLLLSFEDRNDLEKEEYSLIKTYDIPFRGKKAWPSFRSFKPGFYPWFMDNEEAYLLLVALEETLKIVEEVKDGMQLPHLVADDGILIRVPKIEEDYYYFESKFIELDKLLSLKPIVELEISELDIKRIKKNKKIIPIEMEYVITYVDMPIEGEGEDERPFFPMVIIAADHESGQIIHHDMKPKMSDVLKVQTEFIELIQKIGGIPSTILTNYKTAIQIVPVVDALGIHIEVLTELPVIDEILEGLQGFIE